jgi:hypothetical protein
LKRSQPQATMRAHPPAYNWQAARPGSMRQGTAVPMTAREIALTVAAAPFPLFPPQQLLMTSNEVWSASLPDAQDKEIWVMGIDLGQQTGEKKSTFWRVMWVLFFPLILLWHSIRIYFLPCLQVYADRFFGTLCLSLGQTLCCMCTCKCWRQQEKCFLCEFEDPDFPPEAKSLGKWKGKSGDELNQIKWKRAAKLGSEPPHLFQGGIQAEDIAQGQLGDCWLMAALACLSEHPAAIQRCFLTRERNVRGCYRIQLYDGQKKQFVQLSIDDFLPTENDQPLFAKPKGSELWVLLLEKAFAKLFGDYHSLEGGHLAVAFEAMTGVSVCALVHAGSTGPIESSKSSNNSELSTLLELNAEAPRV